MKKILMLTICLALVPMLFGAVPDADVANKSVGPKLSSPRSLLVDRKPIDFVFDRSDLLFDQQATHYTTFDACQNDSIMGFYPRIADNFTVVSDASVDSLVWWGGYWGTMTNSIMDFLIEIYPDSAGFNQPTQNPIYSARVGFTETLISLPDNYYYYEAVIPPFAATGGVTYYIVFQPFLYFPPQWGNNCDYPPEWGDGQEQYFKSPYFGYPDWVPATTVFGRPDETSFQIYGTTGGAVTLWDFEDGWQGWTNTNGDVFPYAWGIEASDYQGASWICPDAGDSSLWIDSDAAGSGGYLLEDTALSPVLAPNPTMDWLKYGVAYNFLSGGEYLEAGIKYFDGATWTVAPLKTYTADFGPTWDSVDVSAYAGYVNVQVYFYYTDVAGWYWYAAIDNVSIDATIYVADHDVGCSAILSPPAGQTPVGDYDVIGRIQNYGNSMETFDVTANVWDTVGMVNVFSQTVTLTDFPVAGDSGVNFGMVTFNADSYYYTVIYTELVGDVNPANDTSSIYSTTAIQPGDVIFELDAEAITGDIRLLGVEFDGEYFYVTGATDMTQTMVYVIDTAGTLIGSDQQPAHSTSWGWRDIAWDYAYRGPDRIDTLYSSVDNNVDKWGYDFVGDSMIYYGAFPGPELPNRALAYDGDDGWFFTGNFSSNCYKFSKTNPNIQSVANTLANYGSAYDFDTTEGPWVWWHSQDDLGGTGYSLTMSQMEPVSMAFTGYYLSPIPTMSATGMAGGLCYWSDFRGMDVLFGMNQGTPDHIFGVFVRMTPTGIEDEPDAGSPSAFGFAPSMATVNKGPLSIAYTTTTPDHVSLKVYDGTGRLVTTLVDEVQRIGVKTVHWNTQTVSSGVYFLRLEANGDVATHKLILVQ